MESQVFKQFKFSDLEILYRFIVFRLEYGLSMRCYFRGFKGFANMMMYGFRRIRMSVSVSTVVQSHVCFHVLLSPVKTAGRGSYVLIEQD